MYQICHTVSKLSQFCYLLFQSDDSDSDTETDLKFLSLLLDLAKVENEFEREVKSLIKTKRQEQAKEPEESENYPADGADSGALPDIFYLTDDEEEPDLIRGICTSKPTKFKSKFEPTFSPKCRKPRRQIHVNTRLYGY